MLKTCIDTAYLLMKRTEDFQRKPVVDMVHGKYLLFHKGDVEGAKQKYDEGIQMATLIGNSFLASQISEEWTADFSAKKAENES